MIERFKNKDGTVRAAFTHHWYCEHIASTREPTDAEYDTYLANFARFLRQAVTPAIHFTVLSPNSAAITATQRERFAELVRSAPITLSGVAVVAPSLMQRGAVMVFNWVVRKEPRPELFANVDAALAWARKRIPAESVTEIEQECRFEPSQKG